MKKKAILIITDGIGYNPNEEHNAFAKAKTPTYDMMFDKFPNSKIKTSGISVGLPDGQMGNSEVGHMSLGSGRVMYQDLVKINKSIEDASLFHESVFDNLVNNSHDIHLIGLMSDGGVHSLISHIKEIAFFVGLTKKVYIHIITDGRDVSPSSAKKYIDDINDVLNENIVIATISGRFYAMDRDNRWDRVQLAYDCIVLGANPSVKTPNDYIDFNYDQDIYDEFIQPASLNGYLGIKQNDGVIFCNFRSDRMREICDAIGNEEFDGFPREYVATNILTMTSYSENFDYPVWVTKIPPKNTLSEVISKKGLTQLHISETEKYAHVTFFLNGGIEKPFKGEDRTLIPSPDVRTYDEEPQMKAKEIADGIIDAMSKDYDYIVANFANGDMVGHTGDFDASIKAVEAVDEALGRLLKARDDYDYDMIITSDHGNCEEMKNANGDVLTNHTTKEVFAFCISDTFKSIEDGSLSNIAPSILLMMDLDIPSEMDNPIVSISN